MSEHSGRARFRRYGRAWCEAWASFLAAQASAAGWHLVKLRDHGETLYVVLEHAVRGFSVVRISTHPSGTFKAGGKPGRPQKCFSIQSWRNAAGLHVLCFLVGHPVRPEDLACPLPPACRG